MKYRAEEEKKRRERSKSPEISMIMPSVDMSYSKTCLSVPIKHPSVSTTKHPSLNKILGLKTKKSKTLNKSRRSFLQKSTPKLDTLLSIVDDNRKMYKKYLVDRVPTIDVT